VKATGLFDLRGRTALVTGGGRGLGRPIALGLAEAGADVIVESRKRASCEETVRAIEACGLRGVAFEVDLAREEQVARLAEQAIADPETLRRFLEQIPQRRAGGEDDVKGAAVFLCSDAAAYATGQVLVVDGGWLVRG